MLKLEMTFEHFEDRHKQKGVPTKFCFLSLHMSGTKA